MPTALLIVDHGSRRAEANDMLEGVGDIVRKQRPELIVHTAHMELADPTIADGVRSCIADGATEIIVHPYMLSPGRHATSRQLKAEVIRPARFLEERGSP